MYFIYYLSLHKKKASLFLFVCAVPKHAHFKSIFCCISSAVSLDNFYCNMKNLKRASNERSEEKNIWAFLSNTFFSLYARTQPIEREAAQKLLKEMGKSEEENFWGAFLLAQWSLLCFILFFSTILSNFPLFGHSNMLF